jgi:hypothetical protein
MTKAKGLIEDSLAKYGYIQTHFYKEEIEAISNDIGCNAEDIKGFRNALIQHFGLEVRQREKMTSEEKTAKAIERIALNKSVSKDDIQKILSILKLK